jgi:Cys-tRNA(Pro) deacylase
MHPNTERVIAAGQDLGVAVAVRTFPEGTKTAADAASAIGVEVGQIVKSLVFTIDDQPVIALVSGANQLDERRLAVEAGGAKCRRADADLVRSATGYPIGGVPPFGHSSPLPVYVDRDLLSYGEVWAAAGTWNDVFPIDPATLVRATAATVADLRRG